MKHEDEAQPSVPATSRMHALLIGIDAYPQAPLRGCVNDACAMRELLLEKKLLEESDLVFLASPSAERQIAGVHGPAKAKRIRDELARLARVPPGDRVFIYYAGHGASVRAGGRVARQHEALLPQDAHLPNHKLFDHEVNGLLSQIADRTAHVTVVLDCCHSAGATREPWEFSEVNARSWRVDMAREELHVLATLDAGRELTGIVGPTLEGVLVVAGCCADEVAIERTFEDGTRHGVFTRALVTALRGLPADRFGLTAWRDLWAQVICGVAPHQHPRVVGNDARVLDGRNVSLEPGALSVRRQDGAYQVAAGLLADVTPGTVIEVKSGSPLAQGSPALGVLRVVSATQRDAVAEALADFEWPAQPFCRVKTYGKPVLQVAVRGELTREVGDLSGAELVRVPEPGEVLLVQDGDESVVCDELFGLRQHGRPELARVALNQVGALLRHLIRYRAPLRLAKRCTDLPGAVKLLALDTTNAGKVSTATELAELPQSDGAYHAPENVEFCLEAINTTKQALHVTLFNVARSGRVQFIEAFSLAELVHHRLWHGGVIGRSFCFAGPAGYHRLVAIASTDLDANFRHLELAEGFADLNPRPAPDGTRSSERSGDLSGPRTSPPPLLWTATSIVFDTRDQVARQNTPPTENQP